jgi:putative tricarboxylic transport membrane protein
MHRAHARGRSSAATRSRRKPALLSVLLIAKTGCRVAAVVLGLFALSQALVLSQEQGSISQFRMIGNVWDGFLQVLKLPATVLRASIVGIFMGVLPALGLSSANVVAYFTEKRAAKDPEKFGQGDPRGLLAPEIAKNACIVGDLIPTFALGIPALRSRQFFSPP